jgi:hypothetical protein
MPRTFMDAKYHLDFNIKYHWVEGSLSPPYHYEYSLSIVSDGSGTIIFRPDYEMPGVPVWKRDFIVPHEKISNLVPMILQLEKGVRMGRQPVQSSLGSSQEWCAGSIAGVDFHIPAELPSENSEIARKFYAELNHCIPQGVWDELHHLREEYMRM